MGAVKDMFYDIETMFIEGHTARQIAAELKVPLEEVEDVLDSFGVSAEDRDLDVDAADWDEIESDDYYET